MGLPGQGQPLTVQSRMRADRLAALPDHLRGKAWSAQRDRLAGKAVNQPIGVGCKPLGLVQYEWIRLNRLGHRHVKPFGWKVLLPIILSLAMAGVLSHAAGSAPVSMRVEPAKQIYTRREGLMMKFTFTAREKTKLCLDKDPLTQMQLTIHRAGHGKMELQPLVVRDNRALLERNMKVRWLEPGEQVVLRANIKRLGFAGGGAWEPGEYSVRAVFHLCEQTPNPEVTDIGREIPVSTDRPGWFMIMI